MSTDEIVFWALLSIVGGATAIGVAIIGWLLLSFLTHVRNFDAFVGEVRSQYVSTTVLEKALESALAPLAKEIEACVRAQMRQGRLLDRIASKLHIHVPAVDTDED